MLIESVFLGYIASLFFLIGSFGGALACSSLVSSFILTESLGSEDSFWGGAKSSEFSDF
jgi:hypothetical protein